MILSEYEAKRADLDTKMQELNTQESEKKNGVVHKVSGRVQAHTGTDRTVKAQAERGFEELSERQGMVARQIQDGEASGVRKDAPVETGVLDR